MFPRIRRLQSIVLLALLLGLLALPLAAHAQEKSLVWDRFDVDIHVKTDGTFDVAEHQRIRFTAGSFTFGFREIPINKFDRIDNWAMTDSSGNRYELTSGGSQPYTFTVDDSGYSYTIRWYFPATADTSETYSLSYTVHGGLRLYEGGDQLWWKAIYSDRSFPVLNGRVNVSVPADIQEWGAYINARDAKDSASATLLEGRRQSSSTWTDGSTAARILKCGCSSLTGLWPGVYRPGRPRPMRRWPRVRPSKPISTPGDRWLRWVLARWARSFSLAALPCSICSGTN